MSRFPVRRAGALLLLLNLTASALAQNASQPTLAPLSPAASSQATGTQTTVPNAVPDTEPAPLGPVNVPTSMVLPAALGGVSAALTTPAGTPRRAGQAAGALELQLELQSALTKPLKLSAARDNGQDCAFAPAVRVLRVGTREVVYPAPGAAPRLCAQDIRADTLSAGGRVKYARTLSLAPGEYMVEGWWTGTADGVRVKVPAEPLRVTVK